MTADHPLITAGGGHTELLLGNEAIVRGAIEAGVGFACGYPGTPSTEVTDTFAQLAPHLGIPFEYSVNEKVALEMAFAASLAGVRSIVAMKHLGLMSAGDRACRRIYTWGGKVPETGRLYSRRIRAPHPQDGDSCNGRRRRSGPSFRRSGLRASSGSW